MSNQPEWSLVYSTDYSALHVDTTGVYPPELTIVEDCPLGEAALSQGKSFNKDTDYSLVYRFPLERCTFVNNVLSDNKFHPELNAWFASDLSKVARSNSVHLKRLVMALTSDNPKLLAMAYECIGSYNGFMNFDEYPIIESEAEVTERLSK